jgi:hypothetical protein
VVYRPGHLSPVGSQALQNTVILRSTVSCARFAVMGHRQPEELLLELRTYLEHFDQTGDLGEGQAVAEIKNRLLGRIREVEAQLRFNAPRKGVKSVHRFEGFSSRIAS